MKDKINKLEIKINNIKEYPFIFQYDEGNHIGSAKEWWYGSTILNGEGNKKYGLMFSYNKPGIRFFVLTNLTPGSAGQVIADSRSRFHDGTMTSTVDHTDVRWTDGIDSDYLTSSGVFEYSYSGMDNASGISVSLTFQANAPPILHNSYSPGFIRMGTGGLSAYYSIPDMDVHGIITIPGVAGMIDVAGSGWIDRQWGNWDVKGYDGWDWYPMQLSNGKNVVVDKLYSATESDTVITPFYTVDNGLNTTNHLESDYYTKTGGYSIDEFAFYYVAAGDIRTHGATIALDDENAVLTLTPYNYSTWGFEIPRILSGTWNGVSVTGNTFIEATHRWEAIRETSFIIGHDDLIEAAIPVNYSANANYAVFNGQNTSWMNRITPSGVVNTLYGDLNGADTVSAYPVTVKPNTGYVDVTLNTYNSGEIDLTVNNQTSGATVEINAYDGTFDITNGKNYRILENGATKKTRTASGGKVTFETMDTGKTYEIKV